MIHVIAEITVADGQRDRLLAEFQRLVPLVHAEQGCLEYGSTIDADTNIDLQEPARSNVVTVVEKWESEAALRAHLAAPHMIEYRDRVADIVTGVDLRILRPA